LRAAYTAIVERKEYTRRENTRSSAPTINTAAFVECVERRRGARSSATAGIGQRRRRGPTGSFGYNYCADGRFGWRVPGGRVVVDWRRAGWRRPPRRQWGETFFGAPRR